MKVVFLILGIAAMFGSLPLFAQTNAPPFLWVRSGGGANTEFASAVAVDPAGNSHVIGKIHGGSANFSGITVTNQGLFVAKYDSTGTALWVKAINIDLSSVYDNLLTYHISTDDAGNTYVGGDFALLSLGFGETNLQSEDPNDFDMFLAKYDPQGNLAWARTSGNLPHYDIKVGGMACDPGGNCYLTGLYFSADALGLTNRGFWSWYVAKFDSSGNLAWARPTALITDYWLPHSYPLAIGLGPGGDYYVAGEFAMTNLTLGNQVLTNSGVYSDIFLARYDAAGNVIWARSGGGPDYDTISGLSIDQAGSCYVGALNGGTYPLNFSGCTIINSGAPLGAVNHGVVKYDRNGNVLWCRGYGGVYRNYGQTVDASGNSYFLGLIDRVATMAGLSLTNQGGNDYPSYFLFKLNPDGRAVWGKQFGGGDFLQSPVAMDFLDIQGDVGVNSAGDCSVVGYLNVTNAPFDGFTLSTTGGSDMFVARFEAESPRLKITASATVVVISWPTNQAGFGLERAASLNATVWESVTNQPQVVGMENEVTQSASDSSRFFRLRKH